MGPGPSNVSMPTHGEDAQQAVVMWVLIWPATSASMPLSPSSSSECPIDGARYWSSLRFMANWRLSLILQYVVFRQLRHAEVILHCTKHMAMIFFLNLRYLALKHAHFIAGEMAQLVRWLPKAWAHELLVLETNWEANHRSLNPMTSVLQQWGSHIPNTAEVCTL